MNQSGKRTFEIQHTTVFEYEYPVQRATMMLRLQPQSDARQQVLNFGYTFEPDTTPVVLTDSLGNLCHLIDFQSIERSAFVVTSNTEVCTMQSAVVIEEHGPMSWKDLQNCVNPIDHWAFLAPSKRVYPCPELVDFITSNAITQGDDPFSALRSAASTIYKVLNYRPGSTEVTSKIEDCLEQKSGVCQDFTHIMLAIGRNWGVPSRYVSGYLHLFADKDRVINENASHAWAEFFLPEMGWVSIDATNDMLADNRYVRVSVGRDYNDVAPTKGMVIGGGHSTLDVKIQLAQKTSHPCVPQQEAVDQQ